MDLIDAVAAQMYDDASDPEDPHWDDLREQQRHHWQRRARNVLDVAAAYFERQAEQATGAVSRALRVSTADHLRPL